MSIVKLLVGDCRTLLKKIPDDSIDSVVCDPPYELNFMGKGWDSSGIAYDVAMWSEVFRVLKPGGHLLAFGGTRTHHRMTCAIEDAGFEVRDEMDWVYGSGFPKSMDISKAIDKAAGAKREVLSETKTRSGGMAHISKTNAEHGFRPKAYNGHSTDDDAKNVIQVTAPATDAAKQWQGWGTALKPAREPIVVARKPFDTTVAVNVLEYGTGGLNIDACRIATSDSLGGGGESDATFKKSEGWARPWMQDADHVASHAAKIRANVQHAEALGRWPANVILTHSDACEFEGTRKIKAITGTAAGRMAGKSSDVFGDYAGADDAGKPTGFGDEDGNETVEAWECAPDCPVRQLDEQSGPKCGASAPVRGTEPSDPAKNTYGKYGRVEGKFHNDKGGASRFFYTAKTSKSERNAGMPEGTVNDHPTIKPIELMRYLVRLVTPPNGIVLDPFMGSGSTGCAAVLEGFNFIGIDLLDHHAEIAGHRIKHWQNFEPAKPKPKPKRLTSFKRIESDEGPCLPI